jgi:hypothetical protein
MLRLGLLTHNWPLRSEITPDAGGFVSALAAMLHGSKCEVNVFCQSGGIPADAPPGIKLYEFPWSSPETKLGHLKFYSLRDFRSLSDFVINGRQGILRFIREYGIDHCLALWAVPSGYFAHHAKMKLGVPYTIWALGSDINQYYRFGLRGTIRRVLRQADHICADGLGLVEKINSVIKILRVPS